MEVKKKLLLPLFFSLLLISFYQQSTIHKMLYFFYVSVRIATSRQKKRFCWEDTLLWWHVARFFQNMLFTIKKNTIKIKNKAWKGRQKVRLHMLSFHIVIFSLTFFFCSFFFVFGVHLMQSKDLFLFFFLFRPEACAAEIFGS